MSQEEEKELKELVTQCLASKGFLGKIQAEIRAGVFVALEEENVFKEKNVFINQKLKDFITTPDGLFVISLVREFIEFFNLEFTATVFDPETNAGVDYKFEGRSKLAEGLKLAYDDETNVPLLGLLMQSLISRNTVRKTVNGLDSSAVSSEKKETNEIHLSMSPLINLDESALNNSDTKSTAVGDKLINKENEKCILDESIKSPQINTESNGILRLGKQREIQNVTSLAKLPPLNKSTDESKTNKIDMSELNTLLQFEPEGGDNYEDDFISSESEKKKTESLESEIEEDLPSQSNHSNPNDVTFDVSVSKASGHADYSEDISA